MRVKYDGLIRSVARRVGGRPVLSIDCVPEVRTREHAINERRSRERRKAQQSGARERQRVFDSYFRDALRDIESGKLVVRLAGSREAQKAQLILAARRFAKLRQEGDQRSVTWSRATRGEQRGPPPKNPPDQVPALSSITRRRSPAADTHPVAAKNTQRPRVARNTMGQRGLQRADDLVTAADLPEFRKAMRLLDDDD